MLLCTVLSVIDSHAMSSAFSSCPPPPPLFSPSPSSSAAASYPPMRHAFNQIMLNSSVFSTLTVILFLCINSVYNKVHYLLDCSKAEIKILQFQSCFAKGKFKMH